MSSKMDLSQPILWRKRLGTYFGLWLLAALVIQCVTPLESLAETSNGPLRQHLEWLPLIPIFVGIGLVQAIVPHLYRDELSLDAALVASVLWLLGSGCLFGFVRSPLGFTWVRNSVGSVLAVGVASFAFWSRLPTKL